MAVKSYVVNWPLKLNDKLFQRGDVIEQEEKEVAPLIGGVLSEFVPDPPTKADEDLAKNLATKPKAKAKN